MHTTMHPSQSQSRFSANRPSLMRHREKHLCAHLSSIPLFTPDGHVSQAHATHAYWTAVPELALPPSFPLQPPAAATPPGVTLLHVKGCKPVQCASKERAHTTRALITETRASSRNRLTNWCAFTDLYHAIPYQLHDLPCLNDEGLVATPHAKHACWSDIVPIRS